MNQKHWIYSTPVDPYGFTVEKLRKLLSFAIYTQIIGLSSFERECDIHPNPHRNTRRIPGWVYPVWVLLSKDLTNSNWCLQGCNMYIHWDDWWKLCSQNWTRFATGTFPCWIYHFQFLILCYHYYERATLARATRVVIHSYLYSSLRSLVRGKITSNNGKLRNLRFQ